MLRKWNLPFKPTTKRGLKSMDINLIESLNAHHGRVNAVTMMSNFSQFATGSQHHITSTITPPPPPPHTHTHTHTPQHPNIAPSKSGTCPLLNAFITSKQHIVVMSLEFVSFPLFPLLFQFLMIGMCVPGQHHHIRIWRESNAPMMPR